MSSNRKVSPVDPGASDVFDSSFWSSRKGAGLGLDMECTKAAVDLQNLTERTAESVVDTTLETLRRATGAISPLSPCWMKLASVLPARPSPEARR
jgi:hypothetical protein